jgi:uncharacterized protein CbrC (UPF0167 family)
MLTGKVLVRTVTNYYVGELVDEAEFKEPGFFGLRQASWVADTGRFSAALKTGTLSEVEPYPADDVVLVNKGAVVDIAPWHHELPEKVK